MVIRRLPNNELYHHGIKGQKWGVRRYQNADGSLTDKGRLKYTLKEREDSLGKVSTMSDEQLTSSIKRMQLEKQYRTVTKENIDTGKKYLNSTLKTVGKVALGAAIGVGAVLLIRQAITNQRSAKMFAESLKRMSDGDLEKKITRLSSEQRLANLVNERSTTTNPLANNIISTGATTVLTSAVAGAMAYALNVAITGKAEPEQAAQYIAPSPKKKK